MVWGLFVAPKAKRRVALPARLVPELLVFGAATAALVAAELLATGAVLGALALVSSLLNASQERGEAS